LIPLSPALEARLFWIVAQAGCWHKHGSLTEYAETGYTNISTEVVKVSITVEHEKRKREILEKALEVFVDEGYEDTTFQKIAERCGITRTILYLYFKNKREIFTFSIKLFSEKLETEIQAIVADPSRRQVEKLSAVLSIIFDGCARNRQLLTVILDYLEHLRIAGGDPGERVRRRTIRMRHILAGIIIEGQKSGEFARVPVKAAADAFYALMEASIFRIAVLGGDDSSGLHAAANLIATGLVLPYQAASRGEPRAEVAPGQTGRAAVRPRAAEARPKGAARSPGEAASGGTARARR
jgi:AcrR family transcriptional regulator